MPQSGLKKPAKRRSKKSGLIQLTGLTSQDHVTQIRVGEYERKAIKDDGLYRIDDKTPGFRSGPLMHLGIFVKKKKKEGEDNKGNRKLMVRK